MGLALVQLEFVGSIAIVRLNDPDRRNALSTAMFDALESVLAQVEEDLDRRIMLLCGAGKAFCAGFDLAAGQDDPALIGRFIVRLSRLTRTLRRMSAIVVASVHGPALAGGCAIISACDFVVAARGAKLGYPVHPIGVSPAVTIPTLRQAIGDGAARTLLMGGEIITGERARQIGLVTHLAPSADATERTALDLARSLAEKPPGTLRITKQWLNEIDGSLEDGDFAGPAEHSAGLAESEEAAAMLQAFWRQRQS